MHERDTIISEIETDKTKSFKTFKAGSLIWVCNVCKSMSMFSMLKKMKLKNKYTNITSWFISHFFLYFMEYDETKVIIIGKCGPNRPHKLALNLKGTKKIIDDQDIDGNWQWWDAWTATNQPDTQARELRRWLTYFQDYHLYWEGLSYDVLTPKLTCLLSTIYASRHASFGIGFWLNGIVAYFWRY